MNSQPHEARNIAFSLVELSVVLVILGLLTGGVLTGQSLIRAAELRGITTEFTTYQTAAKNFKDTYFALPGDITNATDFWGEMTTGTCPNATGGTGKQTCNGDGDGLIDLAASANQTGERFMLWQHLANAGLIDGNYTGRASTGGASDSVTGVNIPRSKVSSGGWGIMYAGSRSGHSKQFDGEYGNRLVIGAETSSSGPAGDLLSPKEAWNIDTKTDDGNPASGKVVVHDRVDCTVQSDGSAITNSAGHAALIDSKYNLTNGDISCALNFREVF